jgi:hypothetical protein
VDNPSAHQEFREGSVPRYTVSIYGYSRKTFPSKILFRSIIWVCPFPKTIHSARKASETFSRPFRDRDGPIAPDTGKLCSLPEPVRPDDSSYAGRGYHDRKHPRISAHPKPKRNKAGKYLEKKYTKPSRGRPALLSQIPCQTGFCTLPPEKIEIGRTPMRQVDFLEPDEVERLISGYGWIYPPFTP